MRLLTTVEDRLPVTNGPQNSGRLNGMAGFFECENDCQNIFSWQNKVEHKVRLPLYCIFDLIYLAATMNDLFGRICSIKVELRCWLCQQKSTNLLKAEHLIVTSSWNLVSRVYLIFILETKFVFDKIADTHEKANAGKERDLSSKMIWNAAKRNCTDHQTRHVNCLSHCLEMSLVTD